MSVGIFAPLTLICFVLVVFDFVWPLSFISGCNRIRPPDVKFNIRVWCRKKLILSLFDNCSLHVLRFYELGMTLQNRFLFVDKLGVYRYCQTPNLTVITFYSFMLVLSLRRSVFLP